jgi:hypothetical protein
MSIKASLPNGSTITNEATGEVDEASGSFAFLGLAPGNKPYDNPDYQNDQNSSHPDSVP